MFKKKPTIKNLSPLRSSDRRKIADQIISDYRISIPSSPAETNPDPAAKTAPQAPNLSSIRSALLPENSLTARFTTTAGPDLREVQGVVYVGAHPGEDERVLWFKVEHGPGSDKKLYPTVYTLWHNPDIVPLLHTPEMVMRKLHGGADLMTPGIANDPPFDPRATKGSVVAVASLNSHTVPLFVGICEIDVSTLGEVQGTKGHAIRGLQWEGDELWAWSSSSRPGRPPPEYIEGWDEEETDELEEGVDELTLGEKEDTANDNMDEVEGETPAPVDEPAVDVKEPTAKDEEIDEAFVNAFVYSLYKLKQDNPSATNHGLTLPVSPSILISNLVTPYLPIYHPQQVQFYNIKKTSWKNVKKFIKHLDKLQLVKAKDRSNQETYVWDVDFDDHRVERFVPYKLPSKNALDNANKSAASDGKKPAANDGSDPSVGQTLTVQTLYRPTAKLVPTIFPALSASDPKNFYKYPELSTQLDQYLQCQDPPLISKENRRIIDLNPFLANTIFTSSSAEDQGTLKRGKTTRDGLLKRIQEDRTLVQPHYAILKPGQTLSEVKPKAGATPKALVTIEKRSGNKVMTKVSNLEVFGIIPNLLAEELQKKCASSTSVAQASGAAKGIMEVLVQGDQRKAVDTALVRRGLKSQWIELVDKTKKKK
ncbi:RNA binding protein Ligatin/Tma64 [Penicillium argentinense]|uniref:RNA binding protein Ligatin/Tma64 n=1 Tax=Penicillium argentinense TaxID=1131581 RepID=A0A9W9EIV4_9EURO|nr:RNA binding protein Ligatin/Tma64 [Penicillium argentinense]KAJ5082617.1 RNA binding protein Ligatin/Tma64 [Penicillium argentinense]